jgi:hypothetical protein
LHFQTLEERRLMAIDTVTSNLDNGSAGTLRSVIAAAASGDTIEFKAGLAQIDLTQGQIEIDRNLIIFGPGANSLTIDQTTPGASLLQIGPEFVTADFVSNGGTATATVSMSRLTLTGGSNRQSTDDPGFAIFGGDGGAILNFGDLTLDGVTISHNSASFDGGAIFNTGTVNVDNSTILDNSAGDGGGIYNSGTLTVNASTISGNSATKGGGIYNQATAIVSISTISANSATSGASIYSESSDSVSNANNSSGVAGTHTYLPGETFTAVNTIVNGAVANVVDGAVVSAAAGTPHQRAVTSVYEDLLGRSPEPSWLAYWSSLLDQGTTINAVTEAIAHSDEFDTDLAIKSDYMSLLGRAADAVGVQYWTAQMHDGLTCQQLEAQFVASDEFFKTAGGTDAAWMDSVYKLLLGRSADTAGETYWTGQLSQGQSRLQVAERIAGGTENNTQLINDDYFHYLGRTADPQGLAYWLQQFAADQTDDQIIAGFTGSEEYYKQHTS